MNLWQNRIYLATEDLYDIVAHPSQHPPATVEAALTLIDHPDEFRKADGANTNGAVDGQVWKQDLIVYAKNVRATEAHAASNKGMPTDDEALADFMQMALEAAAARVQQARQRQQLQQQSVPPHDTIAAVEARQILQKDADLWNGKSTLTAADLQNVLSNPTAHPPETVVASLYMLQHPENFNNASLSDQPVDTRAFADDGPEAIEAMRVLLNDASLWVNKNGITAQDLQNVLDHPEQNAPDTVAAATFLLQHPGTFKIADGLASGGAIDGQIWKRDLVAAIDQGNAAAVSVARDALDPNEIVARIRADREASSAAAASFGDDRADADADADADSPDADDAEILQTALLNIASNVGLNAA